MPSRGRPKGSGNFDWDGIVARLREQPGVWIALPDLAKVSARTIETIRRKERRALRMDDGEIRVRRHAAVVVGDDVLVTLSAQFHPKEKHADQVQR